MEIKPIVKQKLSEIVANRLKEAIHFGELNPGDKLPSEHDLKERFEVSRIVVREALRKLEGTGLIIMKRGLGAYVANAGSEAISDALTSALMIKNAKMGEIIEARAILEPVITREAAINTTPILIDKLKKNIEETESLIKNGLPAKQMNVEFHDIIADASGNRVIKLSLMAILQATLNIDISNMRQKDRDYSALNWHRKIYIAFEERNPSLAADLMKEHLLDHRKFFRP